MVLFLKASLIGWKKSVLWARVKNLVMHFPFQSNKYSDWPDLSWFNEMLYLVTWWCWGWPPRCWPRAWEPPPQWTPPWIWLPIKIWNPQFYSREPENLDISCVISRQLKTLPEYNSYNESLTKQYWQARVQVPVQCPSPQVAPGRVKKKIGKWVWEKRADCTDQPLEYSNLNDTANIGETFSTIKF